MIDAYDARLDLWQTFSAPWIKGVTLNAAMLNDKKPDRLLFCNSNSEPVFVTFLNPTGVALTYNGAPFESLQLAPDSVFIGTIKEGAITALSGSLTPIPFVEPLDMSLRFSHQTHTVEDGTLTIESLPAYNKAQRRDRARIHKELKALREAKKLARED